MVIRELSPELAALAKVDLGEDAERRDKDITFIKDWLSQQRHINSRNNDQWLIAFLRGCKFSLERTKEKLDTYYTMRSAIPEITIGIDPMKPIMQEMLELGIYIPIVKLASPDSPRVSIVRPGQHDAIKISVLDTMRLAHMFSAIMMIEDDNTTIAGQIFIVDLKNVGMNHFVQMTPTSIKKMVTSNQEGMPMRQKGVHHINTPPGFDTAFSLIKMFMNEKNKSRLFTHNNSDMESLYKHVPKEILPQEYGGDGGPIQDMIDHWKKKIEGYRDWFIEDFNYKTDETKRPEKPKTVETIFGIEGSFRQLTVD